MNTGYYYCLCLLLTTKRRKPTAGMPLCLLRFIVISTYYSVADVYLSSDLFGGCCYCSPFRLRSSSSRFLCSSCCCCCIACSRAANPLIFCGLSLFSLYLASRIASSFSSFVVFRSAHIIAALKNSDMK